MRASSPLSISIRHAPQRRPCSSPAPDAAAGALALVERDQTGVDAGDEFVTPGDGLVLVAESSSPRPRRTRVWASDSVALQFIDVGQLRGPARRQLLAPLHDLQQRVLQAGLAPLQGLQLVLQVGELLGVDRARRPAARGRGPPADGRASISALELRAPARRGPRARSAVRPAGRWPRDARPSPLRSARCSVRCLRPMLDAGRSRRRAPQVRATNVVEQLQLSCPAFSRHSMGRCARADTAPAATSPKWSRSSSSGLAAPRILTGPVRDVNQRDVRRPPVLVGGMVAQIGGDVGLHARAGDRVEQRVTRSPAHRDPRHRAAGRRRPAPPTRWRAARRARGRRTPTTVPASAASRPAPDPTSPGHRLPTRRCRTRAPRTDARSASPASTAAAPRAGATISTRSSATRSTVPDACRWRAPLRRAAGTARCRRRSNCTASSRRCARRPPRTSRYAHRVGVLRRDEYHPLVQAGPSGPGRQHVGHPQAQRLGQRVGHPR